MFGYIYLTTSLINNKKYIGQKTSNKFLKESYLGSGKLIQRAINKYGKENFKVELLETCESKQELNEAERYWIRKFNADNSSDFYNISEGGDGGNTYQNLSEEQLIEIKQKISDKLKGVPKSESHREKHRGVNNVNKPGVKRNPKHIEKMRQTLKEGYTSGRLKNPRTGVKASPELKLKLSQNHADVSGKNNPMYGKSALKGKVYIHNEVEQRVISKSDIDTYISLGWIRGKLKKKRSETIENMNSEKSTI